MLFFILLAVISAAFYYIQAWQHALGPRRWALMGLLFGPFILPMFRTHQRMRRLKAQGRTAVQFNA